MLPLWHCVIGKLSQDKRCFNYDLPAPIFCALGVSNVADLNAFAPVERDLELLSFKLFA